MEVIVGYLSYFTTNDARRGGGLALASIGIAAAGPRFEE